VPIARFRHAAEAGYFAHELLCREDVEAGVVAQEQFDALGGLWSTQFLLTVPPLTVERATTLLQSLVEENSDRIAPVLADEDCDDPPSEPYHMAAVSDQDFVAVDSGVNWVPIVLTLAAGSVVLWGWHSLQQGKAARANPAGQNHLDLWDRLATPDSPWTQPIPGGRGRRQLWISPRQHAAELREDADGDGVFESTVRVPLPQARH
jgi:hypothetical protein